MADKPNTSAPEMFLIEKRGFYYRPNAQGYTGLKSEAGRYDFEEAVVRVGPNGPDGPQDGLGIWRESEAPEYSSACPWDVKMKREAYQNGYKAARADHASIEAFKAACRKVLPLIEAAGREEVTDVADWDEAENMIRALLSPESLMEGDITNG